jgi:phage tail sheath gpL-like
MIQFNNIPKTQRTPGVFAEIDNSRALQGLAQNPHKVLMIGQKIAAGTVDFDTLVQITKDGLADGYFGPGAVLARMCNKFKENNPNTELWGMCIGSGIGGVAASAELDLSLVRNSDDGYSGAATLFMMVNGKRGGNFDIAITSGQATTSIASTIVSTINGDSTLPFTATVSGVPASGGLIIFSAVCSGTLGNYLDIRFNYDVGNSYPPGFSVALSTVVFDGGSVDPDLDDVWTIIDDERFNYIIQPYIVAAALEKVEDELADRFKPLVDLQGHGFTAVRGTQASCTTLGNSRNSPHNTIIGAYDSPTSPEEWAAALGAIASFNLNNDPARPLHFLELKGIMPPPTESRFTRAERDILLYDGIATWRVDTGKVLIERCITTYQTNALSIADPSYLDIQTLATLGEIRDQFKIRMSNRFIQPRFKLADDGFPVQPGSYVATPSSIAQEIIALFAQLRDVGLIEEVDEFAENLIVERDLTDVNRVNVLMPPDLINQFRILAGLIQFLL